MAHEASKMRNNSPSFAISPVLPKSYVGIKGARDKFRWMLDNWRFTICSEVLASLD